jgi:DNA-binding MarR family transcriptional regulator
MSKPKDETALNQQVEDLRERMKMLQSDRKANIDVLEANKATNREDIKRGRDENKELRKKLARLQRVGCRTHACMHCCAMDDDKQCAASSRL